MNTNAFALRHIGPREDDKDLMLETIGVDSLDQLIYETIPDDIRLKNGLNLEEPMTEHEYLLHIHELSKKNKVYKTYIGLGYHPTILPAVIQRAYTPYQAEIAQGRLEALLNFQTMVIDLTGMEIANASLLDESTAAAEAMSLLFAVRERSQKKAGINKFFVSENILPQTLSLLQTRAFPIGIELVVGSEDNFDFSSDFFGAILQYPGKDGQITDIKTFISKANGNQIKVAVAADILSLVKLEAPGKFGADVVVGTTQRFGIPMGYGGPHAAYFATKEAYKRDLPGRIIGVTKDANGNRALRMALQTREQHIKRDKATSNICTAQVLLAVMASMYAVYHGANGLKFIANKVHNKTATLANALEKLGYKQVNTSYFDTLQLKTKAKNIKKVATEKKVNLYYPDKNTVTISVNETTSIRDINYLISVFAEAAKKETIVISSIESFNNINESIQRTSEFLTLDVFKTYHSETELMRTYGNKGLP